MSRNGPNFGTLHSALNPVFTQFVSRKLVSRFGTLFSVNAKTLQIAENAFQFLSTAPPAPCLRVGYRHAPLPASCSQLTGSQLTTHDSHVPREAPGSIRANQLLLFSYLPANAKCAENALQRRTYAGSTSVSPRTPARKPIEA